MQESSRGGERAVQESSREGESESDCRDSEDRELEERELSRLIKSGGNSAPLWTEEPDLAGMTRATRAYATCNRVRQQPQKK